MTKSLFYGHNIIGQIPDTWDKAKVDGDLVDPLGGFACAKINTVSQGILHLRPFNITTRGEVILTPDTLNIPLEFRGDLDRFHLQRDDVLFNNTNSVELVGKTGIVKDEMQVAFSNHINRLRVLDTNQIEPKWLALALQNLQLQGFFAAYCKKWIGQAGFSTSMLSDVDIPLPAINEQRRIVAHIEELFSESIDMRELHKKIVTDTDTLISSVLAQVFPSPDQAMPRGWDIKSVEEISKKPQYGYTESANTEPIGPRFLRITDIQNGEVNWDLVPFCEITQQDLRKYQLQEGDIVFARSGATTGKTYLVTNPPTAVFASYLIRIQIKKYATPEFVYWFFQSPYYWRQIITRGGAQPNMNAQLLKKVKIPIPVLQSTQEKIVAQIEAVRSEIKEMQSLQKNDSKLISDMEKAILAQAFRGEL